MSAINTELDAESHRLFGWLNQDSESEVSSAATVRLEEIPTVAPRDELGATSLLTPSPDDARDVANLLNVGAESRPIYRFCEHEDRGGYGAMGGISRFARK